MNAAPLVKLADGRVVLRGREPQGPIIRDGVRILRKGESVSLSSLARK